MPSRTTSPSLLAALAALMLPGAAHADFRYVPDPDSGAPAQSQNGMSMSAPMPVTRMPMAPQTVMSQGLTPGEGETISGFGKQVPLVLALREVVPANYQFAYANGLNLGKQVDWQGGRPWHDVLNDMLASQGLYASLSGQVISIDRQ